MILPYFTLAAKSPTRQRAFRSLVVTHLFLVGGGAGIALSWGSAFLFANTLLILAVVEGAILLGWRLTQLPKSQALEFLLVSQARPASIFLGEALVGLARFALITLAGLPILIGCVLEGVLLPDDLAPLMLIPFLWGAATGLGLATWAYEPPAVRRWGERVIGFLILLYLVVGVLAAEHLPLWLAGLPDWARTGFLDAFRALHDYNPFGAVRVLMEQGPAWAAYRIAFVAWLGFALCLVFLLRAAGRLKEHFHEEHYRPVTLDAKRKRPPIPDEPLVWWAVRRVSKYSGRINLWLAGGFALLYGAFLVFEASWPAWMGRQVFLTFERMGGVPVVTTALVLLAAVPAAFQYGVWDANAQDRSRRLELLLLTELDGRSYWQASLHAAWQRGRGYFGVALFLWLAAWIGGRAALPQIIVSICAGVVLWSLYFAIGFWAFSRGSQGGGLGILLTVGLPILAILCAASHLPWATALTPPGSVYFPLAHAVGWGWVAGPCLAGALALALTRFALNTCDDSLRRWYSLHRS